MSDHTHGKNEPTVLYINNKKKLVGSKFYNNDSFKTWQLK